MSTISNKFQVAAIQDGTTLHGNLVCNQSLTQAWNGAQAIPDWSSMPAADQPLIYLDLKDGATEKAPQAGYKWQYNGENITFDGSGYSSTPSVIAGKFKQTTKSVNGVTMPALQIVGNLASSNNKDVDVIGFTGSAEIDGTPLDFAATIQIRITEITANGYTAILRFQGAATLNADNQSVTIIPELYGGLEGTVSSFWVKWYVNDVLVQSGTQSQYLTLGPSDITDYGVVRAEFYLTNSYSEVKAVAIVGVDDEQDPELMYIQPTGSTALRRGDSVTINIWIGTQTSEEVDENWNTFKLRLLDHNGEVYTDNLSAGIPNAGADGWRVLTVVDHVASVTITYADVMALGRDLTGLILADTQPIV